MTPGVTVSTLVAINNRTAWPGVRQGTRLTSVGIAGEISSPLDEGATLEIARCDGVQADGREDGRVAELGLGSNNAVGDVVVDSLSSTD